MGCLRNSLGDHHAPITNLVFTSIVKQPHTPSHPHHGGSNTGAPSSHHRSATRSAVHSQHDRPAHALHTAHRPSHLSEGDAHHHPLPKHHHSFIQSHHHQGSAQYPHEQISHGVVRLISTSSDGVVHLWATMPHRVVKPTRRDHNDKNGHKTVNSSRQSQRVPRSAGSPEPHGIHADPSPVLHYDQDDGSGLLEPILLKVALSITTTCCISMISQINYIIVLLLYTFPLTLMFSLSFRLLS